MSETTSSIDESIAAAVQAKIHATIYESLAGDETMGRFVTAALNQPIKVKDPNGYRERQTTYIAEELRKVIQAATKEALVEVIAEQRESLKDEIRKALKRESGQIADDLVDSVAKVAESPYRVTVNLERRS